MKDAIDYKAPKMILTLKSLSLHTNKFV
jgi:hypothetical protein